MTGPLIKPYETNGMKGGIEREEGILEKSKLSLLFLVFEQ